MVFITYGYFTASKGLNGTIVIVPLKNHSFWDLVKDFTEDVCNIY